MTKRRAHHLKHMLAASACVVLLCASTGFSPAMDVHPPQVQDLTEATAFFNSLLNTSSNPIIIQMARESLLKIQNGDGARQMLQDVSYHPNTLPADVSKSLEAAKSEEAKMITEVALVPQTDNTYVVPAILNKKFMATFLVDTGASYTVITPETAKALGIEVTAENPTVPVTTANGTVEAPVVTLKNVSLGGLLVRDVQAVVTDLGDAPQLSGLLGMTFFQGMELSFKQDRLVISR